ncbi:NAD(P)/FAD-dependent oxidoreductase [Dyadobacter crusticola]|uniref:NAD(P)/FAD-dependent oxidoreductase n=1 Tax=Dyadobacter crusticola TaxID=292407 RepID=UPI0004E19B6C|nr:NAD(P)/FAD-dependent oxidoreductase [Dyadobacter crusticola]
MHTNPDFDVVIVGGSYAGLSAAMSLGRARWKVAVIDSGKPCNAQTPHSHNFITHDGAEPAAISAAARVQVLSYPTIEWIEDLAVTATGQNNAFTVETGSGQRITTKKILFATGIKDLLPPTPGLAECWGISVIHCPFCHGYEYSDQKTGILVNGETTLDFARLIRNWTPDLAIFTNGPAAFDAHTKTTLEQMGVPVHEQPVDRIVHENGYLTHLAFQDGSTAALTALYHRPPFEQHCKIPETLGVELTAQGHIALDGSQKTTVPGIYAAGDNTTMMRSVANAVAAGSFAGARLSHELISEQYS